MSTEIIGLLGLIILLILMFMRIWIGAVMGIIGLFGYAYLSGWEKALLMIGMEPYSQTAYHPLTAIPLFLLMGAIVSVSGIGGDLYLALRKWVGHVRGGLAMATIGGCGLFAAICGDSVATAVTMGRVAFPEMQKYGYDRRLSVGSIISGGTIGILIPPSLAFILYGLLTEQSIGKLFIAGIIPGILQVIFYMAAIYVTCRIFPDWGPAIPPVSLKEKVVGLKVVWPVVVIFMAIIIGMYTGVFTPTEAGAIGAFASIIIGLVMRRLNWAGFRKAMADTASGTSMIVFMLIGAFVLMRFLSLSQLPQVLGEVIVALNVPRLGILLAIIAFYLIIGCFLNSLAAVILTLPIVFPTIVGLGYDPIWWGVIMVRMIELSMITPPVGINIFVIAKTTNTPVGIAYRGVLPFILADFVHVALLVAIPDLSLYLVKLMG